MKWRAILVSALIFCLAACSTVSLPIVARLPALKSPVQFQVFETAINGDVRQSLLVVGSADDGSWRWIQTDALGAPLARQILQQGNWRNDGFLPPNKTARQLFTALIPVIVGQEDTARLLPSVTVAQEGRRRRYSQDGRLLWDSESQRDGTVQIHYPESGNWTVKALPQ